MKSVKAQSRNLHDLETRCYAIVRGALRKDEFKKKTVVGLNTWTPE